MQNVTVTNSHKHTLGAYKGGAGVVIRIKHVDDIPEDELNDRR